MQASKPISRHGKQGVAASWTWDVERDRLIFDDAWSVLVGCKLEDGPTTVWLERVHSDDVEVIRAAMSSCLRGEDDLFAIELRLQHDSLGWRWVSVVGKVLERSENGRATRVLALFVDITKRVGDAARFWQLFDAVKDVIFLHEDMSLGGDARILDANLFACERLGCTRDELRGRKLMDLVVLQEDSSDRAAAVGLLVSTGHCSFDSALRALDGRVLFMEVESWTVEIEGQLRVLSLARDVSSKRETIAALRESERMMSTLLANLPGVAYRCRNDSNWSMVFLSQGCRTVTGYEPVELLGNASLSYEDVILPADRVRVRSEINAALRRREPFEVEYRIRSKQGSQRWVLERGVGIHEGDSPPLFVEGFVTDVTSRKQLQAQYLHAQKMEAVGQLAGGVAHDFNNMLQVISSCCTFLEEDLPPDSELRETVADLVGAERRAEDLVRQLLAFSRRQLLERKNVDVNDLVGNLLKMMERVIGEHIRLEFIRGPGLRPVRVDPVQIDQALLNLCVNARDAMPDGGTLVIETSAVDWTSDVPDGPTGSCVAISVTDDGCGMDEQTMAHIFEPFFTTKAVGKGTGLGLATVYGIVCQHGGVVDVTSSPDAGTCFRLLLPTVDLSIEEDVPSSRQLAKGGTETILLAEDEDLVRRAAARALQRAGYRVLTARDGHEALSIFECYSEQIDLIILDVVMPRMGGREVHQRIRARKPGARFVFTSGYSDTVVHKGFVFEEGVRFLPKPYRQAQLMAEVRASLGQSV